MSIDNSECIWVCDGDMVWGEANDWSYIIPSVSYLLEIDTTR